MSQLKVKDLLYRANALLDKCMPIFPGFAIIKQGQMEKILDKLDASIPEDIKEAERILTRKEQILQDSQSKADRIILNAQNEANRLLSESELLREVQEQALKIKEQVIAECEEIKRRTQEEIDTLKTNAKDEAQKIREGAENYAEQVLSSLESDLNNLHTVVRNGQDYLEQMKEESRSTYMGATNVSKPSSRPQSDVQFVLE